MCVFLVQDYSPPAHTTSTSSLYHPLRTAAAESVIPGVQGLQICFHHHLDQFRETDFRLPAELFPRFRPVSAKEVHFSWPYQLGIDLDVFFPAKSHGIKCCF